MGWGSATAESRKHERSSRATADWLCSCVCDRLEGNWKLQSGLRFQLEKLSSWRYVFDFPIRSYATLIWSLEITCSETTAEPLFFQQERLEAGNTFCQLQYSAACSPFEMLVAVALFPYSGASFSLYRLETLSKVHYCRSFSPVCKLFFRKTNYNQWRRGASATKLN